MTEEDIIDEKFAFENSFRVRFRRCYVHEDRIELEKKHRIFGIDFDGIPLVIVGVFAWILQLIIPVIVSFLCYRGYQEQKMFNMLYFGLFGLYFWYRFMRLLSFAHTNVVMRDAIEKIEWKQSGRIFKVNVFFVCFINKKGRKKKLPIVMQRGKKGDEEVQKAISIFTQEGLMEE